MKLFMVFIAISWCSLCWSEPDAKEPSMLDVHVTSISNDIGSYIDLASLSDRESKVYSKVLGLLSIKADDLVHYLPHSNSNKTVVSVCGAQKKLIKQLSDVTNSCEGDMGQELCHQLYVVSKLCVAKGYK